MAMSRVAVTTSEETAAGQIEALASVGLEGVELPCIRVSTGSRDDIARLRQRSADVDWILVTSARAVTCVWPDLDMPAGVDVAAVGRATAAAVARAGGRVTLVGRDGARRIVEELSPRISHKTVAYPRASGADPMIVQTLVGAGAIVESEVVYKTVPIPPGNDPVDAVIFGSPSAVDGWRMARRLDMVTIAAIGATTARYLTRLGHPPNVIPDRPDYAELISALPAAIANRASA